VTDKEGMLKIIVYRVIQYIRIILLIWWQTVNSNWLHNWCHCILSAVTHFGWC